MSPVVFNKFPDVTVRIERDIKEGVGKVGLDLERQIVGNITTRGLVDTGNYRRSWTTRFLRGGLEAEIGSPVEYGVYLEYGYHQKAGLLYPKKRGNTIIGWGRTTGRFMPARAHVVPAAESVASRILSYFRRIGQ